MKKLRLFAVLAVLLTASAAQAYSIGTFNIEFFNVAGKNRYVPSDLQALGDRIRESGADVLALQEIEGDTTMRYFIAYGLQGWEFAGNDTKGVQDLYFIWNPEKIELYDGPVAFFSDKFASFEGKNFRVFDRPPLIAKFKDLKTGSYFTLINVHLKSQSTRGKKDTNAAERYNEAKRSEQFKYINELAAHAKGPVFILGDFNSQNAPRSMACPMLQLANGYSYDNKKSNLDFIGFLNIKSDHFFDFKETETRIPRRSTKRSEHPDHDILSVVIN